jgi:hypothetical protein
MDERRKMLLEDGRYCWKTEDVVLKGLHGTAFQVFTQITTIAIEGITSRLSGITGSDGPVTLDRKD